MSDPYYKPGDLVYRMILVSTNGQPPYPLKQTATVVRVEESILVIEYHSHRDGCRVKEAVLMRDIEKVPATRWVR